MPFDFGDVVLVPFPFTSQTASKRRPAVVVSNGAYSTTRPDLIVMAITSQLRPSRGLGEAWLSAWQAAGLLKPSVVKPVFATLEQGLVIRLLGTLGADDQAALRKAIAISGCFSAGLPRWVRLSFWRSTSRADHKRELTSMNETALVQKVWNYAHVLRDQGVPYQAYISQISYLLFLKMDDERAGLVATGLIKGENSAIPEDCRWVVLRDLQGEELTRRY
jgi:mRNA interferase MazF